MNIASGQIQAIVVVAEVPLGGVVMVGIQLLPTGASPVFTELFTPRLEKVSALEVNRPPNQLVAIPVPKAKANTVTPIDALTRWIRVMVSSLIRSWVVGCPTEYLRAGMQLVPVCLTQSARRLDSPDSRSVD